MFQKKVNMKTFYLVLVFLMQGLISNAQAWAPPGATWYYDWVEMAVDGYAQIRYVNDSVVGGKLCKILQVEQHTFDWTTQTFTDAVIGHEYTYLENNIVYYYRYGQFFKLYDFNSAAGSTWTVAGWEQNNPCDSLGSIVVDSTGTTIINSLPLKYLKVSPGSNSEWEFMDMIIERIGSLGYMFPGPNCVVDIPGPGQLRCYYDENFGLYRRSGFPPNCDFIIGVNDISKENNWLKIYPVPASTVITVEINKPINGKTVIQISDISGSILKNIETVELKLEININDLQTGIYFVKIVSEDGVKTFKMIKNSL